MALASDTRANILNIVNEARKKLGLKTVTALTDDWSITAVDYLNDVVAEVNDFGEWQENFLEVLVTASASVTAYTVDPTLPVHNIREVAWSSAQAPLWNKEIADMRRWQRRASYGRPIHWAIMGVEASTGQPQFRTWPIPGSAENNQTFNCLVYTKPGMYDASADVSAVPPYPARLLVKGLLAEMLGDESRGTDNADYLIARDKFMNELQMTYNRFNGDTAGDTFFTPTHRGYRKS